jgi:TolB-like protein/Tfp pilus assembly protein PilF
MGEPLPGTSPPDSAAEDRLDSWKEIAAYLKRDVTTAQRWEKREGMPVHRHVHDKRGSVYAVVSELDAWLQSRRQSLGDEDEEPRSETPVEAEGNRQQSPTLSVRGWLALAGVVVLGLIAVAYFASRSRMDSAAQPKIRSLAVLPLKNLSGDPSQEYLADGMTEALIGRLSGIHDLRVISRTSVMRFKNPQLSVPEIARTLGVDAIVEGSVMREGNRIRVTAQLIRGSTDEHFWSETYDRELQDVFTLQSDLAQSIAEKVQVTVTGDEHERLTAARSVAPEVYESYLKGQFAFNSGNSKNDIEKSVGYFEEAIHRDPTFAPSYVGLALAYTDLGSVYVGASPAETRPKATAAAQKALELDPDIAEAHVLLANTLQEEWKWAEAKAEYDRALELNPNSADAHTMFALWLLCQGRTDEAVSWARRGRELDPVSLADEEIGWILFQSRRYDDAIHELRSILAVRPEDASALADLGFAFVANNQPKDAIPVLEKAISVSKGSPAATGVLIRAYAHAGRRTDALRLLAELQNRRKAGYVPAAAFVNAYLGLGENDQAFLWLEEAYKEQSNILQFLKVHPFFDPIRGDPRFADLLRRVGLG